VVINSMAQKEMARRCSRSAAIIPNVFDFETPAPGIDDYNRDLRREIRLADDDWFILQPTRVVQRKGIEHAIELVRRLKDPRAKLVISQDMTERERSEAMRRDFVANVSHEIRTPLTVLSGFLETMRNLPLTEVEQKRVITLMTQQAERMGNLVGDLLTLAQLEGSPRPAADKWVRVASLFGQVEAEARALSAGRHTIAFAAAGDAQVAGIESELQSAIGNLVSNAVRYTPDGGRIDVAWKRVDNGSGEIVVTDSGRGIAREHLSRLTERFYRVDGSRSRESGGTGLGLAIVKHVIQRHGGELGVASEVGKGSTFRLVLPAARVRVAAPGSTVDVSEPAAISAR
jgi:two-component system phosphate regulon sensor histidine kinase PhoR